MAHAKKAKLGILMLDTRFPRIPGDIGAAETWNFPVEYAVVKGATPQAIVCEDSALFLDAFVSEGQRLVAQGCSGIATSCGFLTLMRPQLAVRLGVPVAASALEQSAQINAMLAPERALSVLTISKASLSPAHLQAAGVPADALIAGVEHTHFGQTILQDAEVLDVEGARQELVAAAVNLLSDSPHTGAILLECTNMAPYASDIQAATGVPVFSIYSYLTWFHQSLNPMVFPAG